MAKYEIEEHEFKKIEFLSKKIDAKVATANDFVEYQTLLNKVGISKNEILDEFSKYDVFSYEQYVKERDSEFKTKERGRIINGIVRGFLIGLASVAIIWVARGIIKVINEKQA